MNKIWALTSLTNKHNKGDMRTLATSKHISSGR